MENYEKVCMALYTKYTGMILIGSPEAEKKGIK